MIQELTLKNFKSFKKLDSFKINDLTVIAGKNSCGKSSILQSLLLLKQTLIKRDGGQLELEGEYLTYSNLKEVSFSMPSVNRASIGYEFVVSNYSKKGRINLSFGNKKKLDHYLPIVSEYKVEVHNEVGNNRKVNFLNYKLKKKDSPVYLSSLFKNDRIEIGGTETILSSFYPEVFSFNLVEKSSNEKPRINKMSFPVELFFSSEMQLTDTLIEDIRNIKYLGPLRALPKRAYVHFTEVAYELLPSGENAAHVLWARQNESVKFKGKEYKLKEALNLCIEMMGLSQEVTPSRIGDLIYKINLKNKDSNADVTISDVGFGYSQVIPIILMCLLSNPGDLILLEQPEIHLHPSSAANLADLFLAFIADGRRIIVETHSAEMISRLRLRVIEKVDLKNKINIAFIESSSEKQPQGATIRQFHIDENGMFPEYPDGFLDESTKIADAIIKARISKNDSLKAPWEK
ncbi:AAA family ATPase [Serratia fonticola]|uniref:AAA family ATPase n=1 Tax=Serratia fonticola TaxID=47917 RepID=UPI00217BCE15|nr:DUF3696 domain-containing protein [Serratia fonticola]CAI1882683.1 Uncharacterized conserved protein [Serratia fonticola]